MPTQKTVEKRKEFVQLAFDEYGPLITRTQVIELCERHKLPHPFWMVYDKSLRVDDENGRMTRGYYKLPLSLIGLPELGEDEIRSFGKPQKRVVSFQTRQNSVEVVVTPETLVTAIGHVPQSDPLYVPFGLHDNLVTILKSGQFTPTFITGATGSGKSMLADQACRSAGRSRYKVNFTPDITEDDLIGWADSPVISAMKNGGVLIIDNVESAPHRLMHLKPFFENGPIFLKKLNKYITPTSGFTIIANFSPDVGNKFVKSKIFIEFLEMFTIHLNQDFPPIPVEEEILERILSQEGFDDMGFPKRLVAWANLCRVEERARATLTLRKMIQIVQGYMIFRDEHKAIMMSLGRYDINFIQSLMNNFDSHTPPPKEKDEQSRIAHP